jgi:hypothetical protein
VALPLNPTGFGLKTGSGRSTGLLKPPIVFESVAMSLLTMVICLPDSLFVAVIVVLHEPSAFVQGV